jgi:hypothetical protein
MSGFISPTAINWLLGSAIAALLLWATVAVVRRPRNARRKPGGLQMLGATMLGFGEPFDPPSRHLAEAKSDTLGEDDESGDPPTT